MYYSFAKIVTRGLAGLALHNKQRELSYLALVAAKNGPRLREAMPDALPAAAPMVLGHIESPRMSMSTLALLLSRFERQTILDPDRT